MKCPNCGSENVSFQSSLPTTQQPKGFLWWLLVGWWSRAILWLVTHIWRLFGHRLDGHGEEPPSSNIFICQNCGYGWQPKKST